MSAHANENLKILPRPPIVAVMGHVDHGKTSLLDYIRKANVASKEAGGITQSIGAYEITHTGKKITFIDTPGHEAFTKMRTRGARIADLAILVVAADEGVKPQTQESIRILQETNTSFIVAITKIDRNNADVEKVKNDLTSNGVLLEGFGGSISYHGVSAKTGEGVGELLDLILLAAELEGITYDPNAQARGFVLEARMDRRRGNEATVIVKNGTLKFGHQIVTPSAQGKVKILEDFTGKAAKELVPSAPALIIGFEGLPQVGEEFVADKELELSKDLTPTGLTKRAAQTGNNWGGDTQDEKVLRVILKASDQGSLEALSGIMHAMADTQPIRILQEGVGDLGDNDVQFAISAQAVVLAFKSRIDKAAKTLGEANKIKILSSEIIYDLVREVELAVKELTEPTSLGELTILAVFNSQRSDKQVVGGKVTRGAFKDRARFSIMRAGKKVAQGRVTNLQQNKEEAHEVLEGNECGVMATSPELIQVGDILVIEPEA